MLNFSQILVVSKRSDIISFCKKTIGQGLSLEIKSEIQEITASISSLIVFDASSLTKSDRQNFLHLFFRIKEKTVFIIPQGMDDELKHFLLKNSLFTVPFPCMETFLKNIFKRISEVFAKSTSVFKPPFHKDGKFHRNIHNQFFGISDTAKKLVSELFLASQCESPVLLRGESGTGKSSAAKLIHQFSGRNKNKYLHYNSASISEELADGILFGVKRGSFTGAENTDGLFVGAHNGTLFLDEIGVAGSNVLAKLLTTMDCGKVYKVGAYESVEVDVRLIFATNENLEEKIIQREFRADFLYRIPMVIHLPPLRAHKEDIAFLAQRFAHSHKKVISHSAVHRLEGFDWPGNVRQLKNVIDQACLFSSEEMISAQMLRF